MFHLLLFELLSFTTKQFFPCIRLVWITNKSQEFFDTFLLHISHLLFSNMQLSLSHDNLLPFSLSVCYHEKQTNIECQWFLWLLSYCKTVSACQNMTYWLSNFQKSKLHCNGICCFVLLNSGMCVSVPHLDIHYCNLPLPQNRSGERLCWGL